MLVLDMDAISIIQRGSGDARFASLVKILEDAEDDVFVTVISLDEQLHGAFNEIQSKDAKIRVRGYRRLRHLTEDYAARPMLDYDEQADAIYERLKGLKGRPATKDLRIASIALSNQATLVTGNHRDFEKVPGIQLALIR